MHRPRAAQWPGLRLRGRGQLDWDLHLRPGLRAGGPGAAQVQGRDLVRPLAPRVYRSLLSSCHILRVSSYQVYHEIIVNITRCQENRCHNNLGALISESRRSSLRRKWAPRNLTFLVFRECEIDCVEFLFGLSTMHIFLCYNCHYHHVGHRQTAVLSKLSSTHSM